MIIIMIIIIIIIIIIIVGLDLSVEVLRSHSDTPHSVGLLWTGDQPVAETFT